MRSKKAIYNIFSNLLLQISIIVYGFVMPKIIISKFGSTVNGLTSSITQFLAYITLLESGFGPVVKSILYKPIAKKDKEQICLILKSTEKFFRKIALIFLIYIVCLSFLYPLIVNSEFDYLYTISLIIIISISTFAEYYFGMTYKLFLQAEQKTYIISIIQIITYVLSVICIIVLARFNTSIHIIKLCSGLIFVLRPLLQNLYVKKMYKIKLSETKGEYKITNKWEGLIQHIAYVVHNNTDVTLLTFFGKLTEISVYIVYSLIINGVKTIIEAFSNGVSASFGDMIAKNENDNLSKKFDTYETFYYIITTICYSCTLILIIPFIKIYTKGINDTNYIREVFSSLIVISAMIYTIRSPYNELTKAAGHFKETRNGALIETISNIIISIILIKPFGLIGVAIGTVVAMLIRTTDLIYHSYKKILIGSLKKCISKITLLIVITSVIVLVSQFVPYLNNDNYLCWVINTSITITYASIITICVYFAFYKKAFVELYKIIKNNRRIKNEI